MTASTWAQLAAAAGALVGGAGAAVWLLRGSRRRAGEPSEADTPDDTPDETADWTAQQTAPAVPSVAAEPPSGRLPDEDDTSIWAPPADR